MKVFITSLKYSPGHFSHLIAYYKLFEELNYEPYLYVDKMYSTFLAEYDSLRYIYSESFMPETIPDIVLFYNADVSNYKYAKYFKSTLKSKILYVYHEPWDGLFNYLKEGFVQGVKVFIAHKYSQKLLKYCDMILLPSQYALDNYKKRESKLNSSYSYFPLIFDDEKSDESDITQKRYFSYIGNAIQVHQFEKYIEFMKYALANNVSYQFLIATKSNIDSYISKDIQQGIIDGKVKILKGNDISNCTINDCYNKSFCIWNLYSRTTQSGVLGKAFMFHTPVIASNQGSFPQYIIDGYNGIIKSPTIDFAELNKSLINIKDYLKSYSANARNTFEKTFYYKTNKIIFQDILNRIKK